MPSVAICPTCRQALREPRPDPAEVLAALRLGPQERAIVDCLLHHFGRFVPSERLVDRLYALDPDGGAMTARNVVSVRICMLRRKLRPHGLAIERGYGSRRLAWLGEGRAA